MVGRGLEELRPWGVGSAWSRTSVFEVLRRRVALPPYELLEALVIRLLFSFPDDSRFDSRFKLAMSLELYSSVELPELLKDPRMLGFLV